MQRSCAAIVQGGKVTLIERKRDGSLYYLFPGGGVEEGETPEEALPLSFRNHVVISSEARNLAFCLYSLQKQTRDPEPQPALRAERLRSG